MHSLANNNSVEIITANINKDVNRIIAHPSPFWHSLANTGSELWLDTGDIDSAKELWCSEMNGLTTNNTLLNNEIQKGIYDGFIEKIIKQLSNLDLPSKVYETGFILTARHGLILSKIFGCRVSIELHTDFSHDVAKIVEYGKRFYAINPKYFVIKIPFTPSGLIGARELRKMGIPVNLTLQFSARQNLLTTLFAQPAFTNVFLGRIGAYMKNNKLGEETFIGEKVTISSQRLINKYSEGNTRLIAASIRNQAQLKLLAGIDVLTIPPKVAISAQKELIPDFHPAIGSDHDIVLHSNINNADVQIEKLWNVSENEFKLIDSLVKNPPGSADELIIRARENDCEDLFPLLSSKDLDTIKDDGKIPVHSKWAHNITDNTIAIDSLLNLAGLASFSTDQEALDNRIRDIIG